MASDANSTASSLRIVREFSCAREKLWLAWTDPERLLRWFGPEHDPASDITADVRPGGAWRACLRNRETGRALYVSGCFEEVIPEALLVFSFRWEGSEHEDGSGVDTVVTVEFIELAEGHTRIILTQAGLSSPQSVHGHTEGWNSCLDRFERFLLNS